MGQDYKGRFLGLGISHYPPLSGHDADMANILRGRMKDPGIPGEAKDPDSWPELMREEWGDDEGLAAAAKHREAMLVGMRRTRQALDEFQPDFVIIWGDDQYENFREDVIPPFSILAYEDMKVFPWRDASESAMFDSDNEDAWGGGQPNVWGENAATSFTVRGYRKAGKYLASGLLGEDFDMAYAYEPLHHPGLAHSFLNSVLYLDYDRRGFDYPVVPVAVNCYGRKVISDRGFISHWDDRDNPLDPPSPSPRRCFDLGAATARVLRDSPWRVAMIASSSWSHAFLLDKTYRMRPDVAADKWLYERMVARDDAAWRNYSLDQLEACGQQEVLNWFALMGAMTELGLPLQWSDFVETCVFNSSKVAAVFRDA